MDLYIRELSDGSFSVISEEFTNTRECSLVWCTVKKEKGLLKIKGRGSQTYRNDIVKAVNAYLKGD